jgi:hypothetical protein
VTSFAELIAITSDAVRLRNPLTGMETSGEANAVVPVYGRRSREDLYLQLADATGLSQSADIRIERVGDCVAPRLVRGNIMGAYLLGRAI